MSPTTKRILLALGLVFLGGVFATVLMPEGFRRLEMYSESDGRRQRDWKYFGLIPYSTTEVDPTLHVTADFWKELKTFGLKVDPAFRNAKPSYVVRTYYTLAPGARNSGSYFCSSTIEADYAATEALYFTQLTGTAGRSSTKEALKMGKLKNGREVMIQLRAVGRGSKPGTDQIEVEVQLLW